jgi:hypothetical protein
MTFSPSRTDLTGPCSPDLKWRDRSADEALSNAGGGMIPSQESDVNKNSNDPRAAGFKLG